MSRAILNIGQIVQSSLNVINPLQSITWYVYQGEVVDDAGYQQVTYTSSEITARIQPVSHDLIFKEKLEFGNVYKRFFVLLDTVETVDRNISTNGDYFKYGNDYYRVMRVPNEFLTGWQEVIGMQTNIPPEGL
jgi:hypothetical protein